MTIENGVCDGCEYDTCNRGDAFCNSHTDCGDCPRRSSECEHCSAVHGALPMRT